MLAVLLLVLVAVVGSTSLMAILGYMWHRIRQVEAARESALESSKVSEQLNAVRDQLVSVEDELAKLNERVDFTERLLEAPRSGPEKEQPSAT